MFWSGDVKTAWGFAVLFGDQENFSQERLEEFKSLYDENIQTLKDDEELEKKDFLSHEKEIN